MSINLQLARISALSYLICVFVAIINVALVFVVLAIPPIKSLIGNAGLDIHIVNLMLYVGVPSFFISAILGYLAKCNVCQHRCVNFSMASTAKTDSENLKIFISTLKKQVKLVFTGRYTCQKCHHNWR